MKQPKFLVIDLFCGAGGVTAGFEMTNGMFKVIAAVNHDHVAILSHWANHDDVKHFEEDITTLELSPLVALLEEKKQEYPEAKVILWASLECTNFSKAKGGLAREADSRTLADHLHRYITALDPDHIMIENVEEFRDWGPSRLRMKDGKVVMIKNKHGELVEGVEPIPERKGEDFKRWCNEVCAHGYHTEWKVLDSANYGAFTKRPRLFGMFARLGDAIVWPDPTHNRKGSDGLRKWKAVKEKIDFKDKGYSIFNRSSNMAIPPRQRKDLSDATLERLLAGCIKHIAGGKDAFRIKYHGGKPRTNDLETPLSVIDTSNRHAVVSASFLSKYYSGVPYNKNISVNGPAGVITTAGGQALVQASFVSIYHGNGDNTHSTDGPMPVIAAADVNAVCFLDKQYSGVYNHQSVEAPAGVIMTNDKHNLVQAEMCFIDSTQYANIPQTVEEPSRVITADRHYPYLISLQWGGQVSSVSKPAPVILATSDKTPLYVLYTEQSGYCIPIYDTDSQVVRELKEFMMLYGIGDIKMRMLRVDELLQIQGFPKQYKLMGTQGDQKKFIGNSVVPDVVKAWALAMGSLNHEKLIAA